MHNEDEKIGFIKIRNTSFPIYKGVNMIGRNRQAAVIIKDVSISQHQALIIVVDEDHHYISDHNSANGTFVDNIRLQPFKLHEINEHVKIHFADKITATYRKITPEHNNTQSISNNENTQCNDALYACNTQLLESSNLQENFINLPHTSTQNPTSPLNAILDDGYDFSVVNTQINETLDNTVNSKSIKVKPANDAFNFKTPQPPESINSSKTTSIKHDGSCNKHNRESDGAGTSGTSIHEMPTQILPLQVNDSDSNTNQTISTHDSSFNNHSKESNVIESFVISIHEMPTQFLPLQASESVSCTNESIAIHEAATQFCPIGETDDNCKTTGADDFTQICPLLNDKKLDIDTGHEVNNDDATQIFSLGGLQEVEEGSDGDTQICPIDGLIGGTNSKNVNNVLKTPSIITGEDTDTTALSETQQEHAENENILQSMDGNESDTSENLLDMPENYVDESGTSEQLLELAEIDNIDSGLDTTSNQNENKEGSDVEVENLKENNTSTDIDPDADTDVEEELLDPVPNIDTDADTNLVEQSVQKRSLNLQNMDTCTAQLTEEFDADCVMENQLVNKLKLSVKNIDECSSDSDGQTQLHTSQIKKNYSNRIESDEETNEKNAEECMEIRKDLHDADTDVDEIEASFKASQACSKSRTKVKILRKTRSTCRRDISSSEDEIEEKTSEARNYIQDDDSDTDIEGNILANASVSILDTTDAKTSMDSSSDFIAATQNFVIPDSQSTRPTIQNKKDENASPDVAFSLDLTQNAETSKSIRTDEDEECNDEFDFNSPTQVIITNTSKKDIFLVPTQKVQLKGAEFEKHDIFETPTQALVETQDDSFAIPTQKIDCSKTKNSIFSMATQKIPVDLDEVEEFDFVSPTQVIPENKNLPTLASNDSDDDFMEPTQKVTLKNTNIFMQPTQRYTDNILSAETMKIDNSSAQNIEPKEVSDEYKLLPKELKLKPQEVESQMEVMFATQSVCMQPVDDTRPTNPLGELLNSSTQDVLASLESEKTNKRLSSETDNDGQPDNKKCKISSNSVRRSKRSTRSCSIEIESKVLPVKEIGEQNKFDEIIIIDDVNPIKASRKRSSSIADYFVKEPDNIKSINVSKKNVLETKGRSTRSTRNSIIIEDQDATINKRSSKKNKNMENSTAKSIRLKEIDEKPNPNEIIEIDDDVSSKKGSPKKNSLIMDYFSKNTDDNKTRKVSKIDLTESKETRTRSTRISKIIEIEESRGTENKENSIVKAGTSTEGDNEDTNEDSDFEPIKTNTSRKVSKQTKKNISLPKEKLQIGTKTNTTTCTVLQTSTRASRTRSLSRLSTNSEDFEPTKITKNNKGTANKASISSDDEVNDSNGTLSTINEGDEILLETKKTRKTKTMAKRGRGRPKHTVNPIEDNECSSDDGNSNITISVPKRQLQLKISKNKEDEEFKKADVFNDKATISRTTRTKVAKFDGDSDNSNAALNSSLDNSISNRSRRKLKPKIVFTMLDSGPYATTIRSLGGTIVDDVSISTVLVSNQILRSQKLLTAVGLAIPICSPDWLNASKKANTFLDPWEHLISDHEAETKWNFSLCNSFDRSKKNKLFQGYYFQLIVNTAADVLKGAIESCGGKCVARVNKTGKFVVIASPENKSKCAKFFKQDIMVALPEAIFDGVLRQEVVFNKHLLK